MLNVYNHILTFTKLATYSASVVKSNFGNFGEYKSLYTVLDTPLGRRIAPSLRPVGHLQFSFGSAHVCRHKKAAPYLYFGVVPKIQVTVPTPTGKFLPQIW